MLLAPHPPTVEACALFACDPKGLETAERGARLARDRLRPWRESTASPPPPVIWRIQGAARAADTDGPVRFDVPGARSAAAVAIRLARWSPLPERPERRFRAAVTCAFGASAWQEASARRGVIRNAVSETLPVPSELRGSSIETLPDPFSPLLEIWMAGYGVRRITEEAILLFAPEAPRPEIEGRAGWRRVTETTAEELGRACFEADLEAIVEMLADGVDPNVAGPGSEVALHRAVRSRKEHSTKVIRVLVRGEHGKPARLDTETPDEGLAPIHLAALLGRTRKISTLVDLGASVDARSLDGRRPLHFAVEGGSEEAVKKLLELGADVEAQDGGGRRPIHCLKSRKRRPGLYRRLLDAGADPNARSRSGWTALHEAAGARWGASREQSELVELLLEAGARQSRDLMGATPADLARYRSDLETTNRLSTVPLADPTAPPPNDARQDPRNPALEEAIWADPDDRDAWIVYGDWLSSRGDPRGELIAVDAALGPAKATARARLLDERARLYRMHGSFLGAGLEPLRSAWIISIAPAERWRYGFLEGLSTYDSPAPLLAAAPRIPACRFLRRLSIEVVTDAQRFVEAMRNVPAWPSLRTLRLSGMWRPFSGAADLGPRLPNLTRLDLEGPAVRDLELSWPGLRALRLRTARHPGARHRLRLRLDLPALSLLDLDVRTEEEIEGMVAVLEQAPQKLQTLRVVGAPPEVIEALTRVLPKTLTTLELVRPTSAALGELERRAPAVEHLEVRIDLLRAWPGGADRVRRLKARLPRLRLGR